MPGVARYRCTSQGPPTVTSVCGCHQGVKCARGVTRYRCTSQGPPTATSVCGCHQGVECAGCCQIQMHITGASYCDFCVWLPSGSKVCQRCYQIQMHITGASYCDFCVWLPSGSKVGSVLPDRDAHHRGLLLRLLCVAAIRE